MKQLIITLFFIYPFLLAAQTSGEIVFTETVQFEIDLPEGMEQFKDKIPSSQNFQQVLLFNESATIYKSLPMEDTEDNDINMSDGSGQFQMQMKFDIPDNQLYQDISTGKTVEKKDFMDKKFLINGEVKRYKWNITGTQKKILNYTCQQAIYEDSLGKTIAWFTSQIPVSCGPASYAGLPGMILALDIDDGKQTILATKVELKDLEKNAIKAPKKGKKVTEEEFEKIVEAKTKELQEEFGGSGNMIIKVQGQ